MPYDTAGGFLLHYRIDGRDGAPWLVFCNSLGTDLHMWDEQVAHLADRFRILRYDRRGHGASAAPHGGYTFAQLGGDVLRLADGLGIARFHLCGLSIGGLTAQWIALHAPERIDRLVLCSTAARIGTPEGWHARIEAVRNDGLAPLLDGTLQRWFSPGFAERHPQRIASVRAAFLATSPDGYVACCSALADTDLRADIARIARPVLAIAGRDDPVTPPDDLRFIADTVQNGRYADIDGRHLCNLESAPAFNALLDDFLTGPTP